MQQLKVLIVDDSWGPASGLQALIETICPEADVKVANGHAQATEVLTSFQPDMVFLDVFLGTGFNLGGSDRVATAERLRDVPCIRMSGDPREARNHLNEQTIRDGLYDKLELPNRLPELLERYGKHSRSA